MDATREPANQGLRGKRYIAYARCAAKDGSATKLQEQVRLIRQFGDSLDMQCVDEVRLAGVSGGPPALRADLRELLARKRERDDFDVLIMEDFARLTRTGLEGGLEIETEFGRCGVQIVYLTEAMLTEWTADKTGFHGPSGDRRNAS
jgi:hypothetical protein